jgi:WD40 repeat protein
VLVLAPVVQVCLCASPGAAAEGNRPELILPLGHSSMVTSVALSSDGKRVLTGSFDRTARLWDVQTSKTLQTFSGHTSVVKSVVLSSDGKRVLTGSWDKTARLWDARTGKTLQTFQGHTEYVTSVALSSDGMRVLTGSHDKTARLWDVQTGKTLQTFQAHTDPVTSVALSSDSKRVLTGSSGKTARLWDARTGKTLQTFQGHTEYVTSVALSSDGKRVLTGSDDNPARLWDVESGKTLQTFQGHTNWVTSVALSSDGKRVLTGWNITSRLYDVETCKTLQTFQGHINQVLSLALSSDGQRVLTGSSDKTARLWDVESGKTLQIFKGQKNGVSSVALSSDGKRVLTGSHDNTARLWDVQTGKTLQTFKGHTALVSAFAFGPANTFLVTASWDGTTSIWRPGRDRPVFSFLHAGDEWIFWTPEGYYTCSQGGEDLIAWKFDDSDTPHGYRVVGPEQFRKTFHRPDLFRHLLSELDLPQALAKADRESGRSPSRPSTIAEEIPPVVLITRPDGARLTINTEECEIAFKTRGVGDNHVRSLQLLVNGRPQRTQRVTPAPGPLAFRWKLSLAAGENRVQVVAHGVRGSFSHSDEVVITRVDRAEALPKLFLLGVGVSAYDKVERKGVEYAASDVKRLVAAQRKYGEAMYKECDPKILIDDRATKAEILDALEELGKKTLRAERAVTLIFLAGHGKLDERGNYYFLAVDSDAQRLRSTAISAAEIMDALKAIRGRVVIFLDTCHSGAFAGDDTRSTGLTDDLVRELASDDCGVAVICSSRGKQLSRQSSGEKAGLFTLAVEEALAGKAAKDKSGAIYLPDLYAYVNQRVKQMSEDSQHPYAEGLKKVGELPLTKP